MAHGVAGIDIDFGTADHPHDGSNTHPSEVRAGEWGSK